jgi:hypothetical protein
MNRVLVPLSVSTTRGGSVMRPLVIVWLGIVLFLGLGGVCPVGAVTLVDGDFSNWSFIDISQSGHSAAFTRLTGGGNPDACVEGTTNSGTDGNDAAAIELKNDLVWNPSANGAISNLSMSIDVESITGTGEGQWLKCVASQGGNYFYASPWGFSTNSSTSWHSWTLGPYNATDYSKRSFPELDGDVNAHPDFSAAGAPLQFGFIIGNRMSNQYIQRYDNWSLTLTSVPEPSTLILLGVAAISLLTYGQRRRRAA